MMYQKGCESKLTLNFAYGECCIGSRVRIPEGAPADSVGTQESDLAERIMRHDTQWDTTEVTGESQ